MAASTILRARVRPFLGVGIEGRANDHGRLRAWLVSDVGDELAFASARSAGDPLEDRDGGRPSRSRAELALPDVQLDMAS